MIILSEHLKESEFRWNYREKDMYPALLKNDKKKSS